MGDTLKKVQSGDPLRIPASTFNTFIDAAIAHRGGMKMGEGRLTVSQPSRDVLLVKNVGDQDINRFEPVYVEYWASSSYPFVVSPADNLDDWQRQPVMTARRWAPMTGFSASWFYPDHACVANEPIAVGDLGRVLYRGLTPVWIDPTMATATNHALPCIRPRGASHPGQWMRASWGPGRLVKIDPDTGWALAEMDHSSPRVEQFEVHHDGGSTPQSPEPRVVENVSWGQFYTMAYPVNPETGLADTGVGTMAVALGGLGDYWYPNCFGGDRFFAAPQSNLADPGYAPQWRSLEPMADAPLGTIRMWAKTDATGAPLDIPRGWALCDSPSSPHNLWPSDGPKLDGRIPIGYDPSSFPAMLAATPLPVYPDDYQHAHDVPSETVYINEGDGSHGSQSIRQLPVSPATATASTLPPRCTVAFIVRVE
jgi:hypothetical protein